MLRRAKRLRNTCDRYCAESGAQHLTLNSDEWRQIDYLLSLTQPFYYYTTCLSKTKETTIHSVFAIYNLLFDHLEKSIAQLARKKVKWKTTMLSALKHAKQKLSDYYAATDEVFGDLYAIATIIAPQYKLQFFSGKNWGAKFRTQYRKSIEKYFQPYQQRYLEARAAQPVSHVQSSAAHVSDLDMALASQLPLQPETDTNDELTRYLGSSKQFFLPSHFSFTDIFYRPDQAVQSMRILEGE
jgi:hypothetical protein